MYDRNMEIYDKIKCRIKSQGKAIPVYCVERDRYYPSRSQAADNSMNIETINLAIKEHRKAEGLTFKYVKEVNLNA